MNTNCSSDKKNIVVEWPSIKAPVCEEVPFARIIHNDTVGDNYFWLNDYFKKGPRAEKVVDYLKAENEYTKQMMASTEEFQKELFVEMKSRIKEKDESVPYFENGYYYYYRKEEGKQYYKICRKKADLNNPEEVLLDVDKMAEGHAYFALGGSEISPDNKFIAFSVDTVSRRQYTIYIKELSSGKILADKVENTDGSIVWANDNKTLFYVENNPLTLLTEKIKKHILGNDKNETVYTEKDNSNYIGVYKSKNNKFIFINSQGTLSSECLYLAADKPEAKFKVFQPRLKNVLYNVTALEDRFIIRTNLDAFNFKMVTTPLQKTSKENWQDFTEYKKDVLVENFEEFKDYVVIQERQKGLTQFKVVKLNDNTEYYIDFEAPAYTAYFGTNREYNSSYLRYGFTSFLSPNSTYDIDLNTKVKKLLKQTEVLGKYNPDDYTSERIYVKSRDNVEIPVSLVYKKSVKKDSTTPLFMTAYGSYGSSYDVGFSSTRLSLLNRGFIFAIVHIRGGQELGRSWYEDGKLLKKMNTFFDFIDVGKYFINNNYSSSRHLYAEGGSAGGLLMGAVTVLEPKLWNGLITEVPFVDVINTMLDETIPLTTNEFDEWGNPKEKEYYDYMKKYSPYENIRAIGYPNILVTTGLHDSQVQYFEPAKYVAKLRKLKLDNGNVLLLKTEMDFGHGGASGRFDYLKELAFNYAFVLKLEGINK